MPIRFTGVKPLQERVLVKQLAASKMSELIIIPETAEKKPSQGRVIEVGPGKYVAEFNAYEPMHINKGDYVLFEKFAGTPVKVHRPDGKVEEFLVINKDAVLAVFTVEGTED